MKQKQFKHNINKAKRQRKFKDSNTKLLTVMFTNMGKAYIKDSINQ